MNDGTLKIEKVTPITDKQPQAQCHFSINCLLDGYPITIEGDGNADSLRALVARLKAIGATPPERVYQKVEKPTDDAPVCEYHGSMKPSKFGGFFCPKKMGDGSHCKSKA